ncbi:MAG: preprotein translocase subunit SecE [Myxococcota bacterium]|nr:preprotein translocase subunit SecE [Myxococcota bacterium]
MADDDNDKDRDEREDDDVSASDERGSDDRESDDRESDDVAADELDDERVARREAADIEREDRELAEGGSEHDVAPITSVLGIERWVQFSFIALALTTFYIADKLITFGWGFAAEPDPTLVSGIAALIGLVGTFALYRHPRIHQLAHEVVSELSKVTWPTKDETYYSTVVVIVTSVIAALYTGVFDALWSAFTDLIYNV